MIQVGYYRDAPASMLYMYTYTVYIDMDMGLSETPKCEFNIENDDDLEDFGVLRVI